MASRTFNEKQYGVTEGATSPSFSSGEPTIDRAAERRLVRKLDLRIMPVLWILYLRNFIDRANIGNAKIAGMEKELVLIGQCAYLGMPVGIIWVNMNAGKGYKRAVTLGAILNFGTAGAFVSSNVFLFKETPRFRTGFSTGLGLTCMGAVAATVLFFACRVGNKKRDRLRAGHPVLMEQSVEELGEAHPDFRYAL